jgi:hypothetical protein
VNAFDVEFQFIIFAFKIVDVIFEAFLFLSMSALQYLHFLLVPLSKGGEFLLAVLLAEGLVLLVADYNGLVKLPIL